MKTTIYGTNEERGGDMLTVAIKKGIESVIKEFKLYERCFTYEEDIRSSLYGCIKKELLRTDSYFSGVIADPDRCNHSLVTLRTEYPCKIDNKTTHKFDIAILDPERFKKNTDPYGFDPKDPNKTGFHTPHIHTLIEIKLFNPYYGKGFDILEEDVERMKKVREIGKEKGPQNLISLGFYQDTKGHFKKVKEHMKEKHKDQYTELPTPNIQVGDYLYLITSHSTGNMIYKVRL